MKLMSLTAFGVSAFIQQVIRLIICSMSPKFALQLILLQHVMGQFATGGASTFNYDASSACSKPYSRNGRQHHEKLPCDFRRQNWCTIAGGAYPWYFEEKNKNNAFSYFP